jgi:hypothetical protein
LEGDLKRGAGKVTLYKATGKVGESTANINL